LWKKFKNLIRMKVACTSYVRAPTQTGRGKVWNKRANLKFKVGKQEGRWEGRQVGSEGSVWYLKRGYWQWWKEVEVGKQIGASTQGDDGGACENDTDSLLAGESRHKWQWWWSRCKQGGHATNMWK
jgi:hypothetical protein